MSVRVRIAAATCIVSLCLVQIPAFGQQLTKEEEVAAQNFNGIDIPNSPPLTQQNAMGTAMSNGQSLNPDYNSGANQNVFSNSMMQNGLQSHLSNQNTQLGQATFNTSNMGGNCNVGMNSGANYGMNAPMNGMNSVVNGANNNNNNPAMNNGGLAQSIGNCLMNDPKMMQRAVGVAGAAALLGVFVGNGGIGGMMRSAGIDNTRHIRGSVVGY